MGLSASQMANASLIAQGAGAVNSAIGAYYGAQSQKSALAGQAALADVNARIAETNAQQATIQGQKAEQAVRLNTAQLKSTQRARLAASGVDLGEGSPAAILASTDVMGEIDAQTAQLNALRQAWGYRTQKVSLQNEAAMERANASAISPLQSTATSLLGSAASVGASWYKLNKSEK